MASSPQVPLAGGITSSSFPVIDLTQPSLSNLREACKTYGFFYIKGHGVKPSLLQAALRQCRAFFALPLPQKQALAGRDHSQGYQALGTEKLDHKEQTQPCTQEGFRLLLTPPSSDQPWPAPSLLHDFRPVLEEYHAAMESVAHRVLRLIVSSIGLPPDYLHDKIHAFHPQAAATTRLLHYAPIPSSVEDGVFGCGAHTDWGCLTLLLTEDKGLEVVCRPEGGEGGTWVRVPPCQSPGGERGKVKRDIRPGSREKAWSDGSQAGAEACGQGVESEWLLICNLGDLLQRWTNDFLRSTPHRVVNREGKDRFSIPFFFSASPTAVVECLPPFRGIGLKNGAQEEDDGKSRGGGKYPPILVSEYVAERLRTATVGRRLEK